jgi:hypothetical protein
MYYYWAGGSMNKLAYMRGKHAAWENYLIGALAGGAAGAGLGALISPEDRLENALAWGAGGAVSGLAVPATRALREPLAKKLTGPLHRRAFHKFMKSAPQVPLGIDALTEAYLKSKRGRGTAALVDFLSRTPGMVLPPVAGIGTMAGVQAALNASKEKTSGFGSGAPSLPEGYVPFGYSKQTKPVTPSDQEHHIPAKSPSPDQSSGAATINTISNYRNTQE